MPPSYLQDAHYPGAHKLGRGTGYEYPHGLPDGVSEQPLLPDALRDRRYYEPTDRGFEAKLTERLAALRKRLHKAGS
jgi:putative ATPase